MAKTTNNKFKTILGDLGRPTLRGIRKCYKCGTFNGTRGISCKNKTCDVVFKENTEKKRRRVVDADLAVKISTGSSSQVYSVRINGKGSDTRGFVQLSINEPQEMAELGIESQIATTYCFVESCVKSLVSRDSLSYLSGSAGTSQCSHLKSCYSCCTDSVPLTLKNSVLNSLPFPSKMRQLIWTLATQSSGPLVQRVSKQNLVVKCKISTRNPLGLLHIVFFDTSKNKEKPEYRFHCGCRTAKLLQKLSSKEDQSKLHCVHFYACLCAFFSDQLLREEFAQYLFLKPLLLESPTQVDQPLLFLPSPSTSSNIDANNPNFAGTMVEEENELQELANGEVELNLSDHALLGDSSDMDSQSTHQTQLILQDLRFSCIRKNKLDIETSPECFAVHVNGDDSSLSPLFPMSESTSLLTPNISTSEPLTIAPPSPPIVEPKSLPTKLSTSIMPSPRKINRLSGSSYDETCVSQSFIDWLASVTERINQTMHYQFTGKPDPIKFQVPNAFFECLQQRISAGTNKKRLPNSTIAFIQKDSLPLGTFTKYTWKITNVLHLKTIFDTTLIPLEVTRRFVRNRDDGFEVYYGGKDSTDLVNFSKLGKSPLIRPVEYKTFLRVGIMSGVQKEPIPFIIEWVPDLLPQCQIGEMTISFQFGHLKNGQLVEWTKLEKDLPSLAPVTPAVTKNFIRKRKIQPNILAGK